MGVNGHSAVIADIQLREQPVRLWAIHPPGKAKTDPEEFARWVEATLMKLAHAGLDVDLTPVVQSDGLLYVTITCDEDTGRKVKNALYN